MTVSIFGYFPPGSSAGRGILYKMKTSAKWSSGRDVAVFTGCLEGAVGMGHMRPKPAVCSHIFLFLQLRGDVKISVLKWMRTWPVRAAASLSVHCDVRMFCLFGLRTSYVAESCELACWLTSAQISVAFTKSLCAKMALVNFGSTLHASVFTLCAQDCRFSINTQTVTFSKPFCMKTFPILAYSQIHSIDQYFQISASSVAHKQTTKQNKTKQRH